jgi:hypothetical protein
LSSQQLETQIQEYPRVVSFRQDPETQETFLKAFLISDKLNKMHWQIPSNSLKKYVNGFIGKPLIQHPSGLHPDYEKEGLFSGSPTYIQDILKHQQQYTVGDIVDVQYEPIKSASGEKTNESAYFAYIKLKCDKCISRLKSASKNNESIYVSPQVIDLDAAGPNEKTFNFIPTHLAIVNEPAYGSHAKIKGMCNGNGSKCMNELKSAAYIVDRQFPIDNSSLVENSGIDQHIIMPKSNSTDQLQQYAQNVAANNQQGQTAQLIDPNSVATIPTPQQQNNTNGTSSGQPLSEKKQVTELTPDGKLVTKTEVSKPTGNNNQQQTAFANPPIATLVPQNGEIVNDQTTTATLNNVPTQQQPPNTTNTNEVAFDWNKLPKEMKQMFENYGALLKKVEDIDNFKRTEEENRVKQAAEQQRATIEQALSVIQDENVRTQLVDFFTSLPISDDQMQNLLNLLLSGTFSPNSNSTNDNSNGSNGTTSPPPAAAAKKPRGFPAKPGLKSAAFINTGNRFATPIEYSHDDSVSGLFGDLDLGNI